MKSIQTRFQEICKTTFAFLVAALIAHACVAQTDNPHNVGEADWKTEQLAKLDQQLTAESAVGVDRDELHARKAWLERWTPGGLTAEPKENEQLPKVRAEPILDSDLAIKLRRKLSWESTDQDDSDLTTLNLALAHHPDDIGLQQLQLHWLDLPIRRKTRLKQIDAAAQRLIRSLNQEKVPGATVELARQFAMYRRARSLAYRELPDVVQKTPIENPQQLNREILAAYRELIAEAGQGRCEFILLEIRVLRRQGSFGKALALVEKYGSVIKRQWYLKKRRDLLKEMGWELPYREAADIYAIQFPEEVAKEAKQNGQRP